MSSIMSRGQCQIGYQKQNEYAELMKGRTLLVRSSKKQYKKFRNANLMSYIPPLVSFLFWMLLMVHWFGMEAFKIFLVPSITLIPIIMGIILLDYHI